MPRISLDREVLRKALAAASLSNSPILQIKAKDGLVSVRSSGEFVSVDYFLKGVDYSEAFSFLVSGKKFKEIISKCYLGDLDIIVEGAQVKIYSRTAYWELSLPTLLNFISLSETPIKSESVDSKVFILALKAVMNSVSLDMSRPYLRMVNISGRKMTACDGVRVQQAEIPLPLDVHFTTEVLPVLKSVLETAGETIEVGRGAHTTMVTTQNMKVCFKNSKSKFPDIEQLKLRPALENKTPLSVDRRELIRATERAKLLADEETGALGLRLSSDSLTVVGRDKEGNSSYDTIPASWKGKDRLLVFNYDMLLSILRSYSFETCNFLLGEDYKSKKSVLLLKNSNPDVLALLPQLSVRMDSI